MEGRNDEAIMNAMIAMTQAITQANVVVAGLQNNQRTADELGMDHPLKDRPPTLCFHCREQGHIGTNCKKSKKEFEIALTSTRVFVLNWEEENVRLLGYHLEGGVE
ncbi:zinc finger protein GIS2 [Trifolium repens]|nr:zinc finger protein GIS2 [Trifolium repens]